jgi:hypothetical protein
MSMGQQEESPFLDPDVTDREFPDGIDVTAIRDDGETIDRGDVAKK